MELKDNLHNINVYKQCDNFEKILITKNNLEIIEYKLGMIESKKDNLREIIKTPALALFLSICFMLPMLFFNSLYIQIALGFVSIKFIIVSVVKLINNINYDKKMKLSKKLRKKMLINEYNKEKEKLKSLELVSDKNIIDYGKIETFHKGQLILELEKKKKLIKHYIANKNLFVKLYKNGLINNYNLINKYSEEDIKFFKFLIEEDLKNENIDLKYNVKLKIKNFN